MFLLCVSVHRGPPGQGPGGPPGQGPGQGWGAPQVKVHRGAPWSRSGGWPPWSRSIGQPPGQGPEGGPLKVQMGCPPSQGLGQGPEGAPWSRSGGGPGQGPGGPYQGPKLGGARAVRLLRSRRRTVLFYFQPLLVADPK